MAFFTCNFHSDVLGKACTMNVIVPQKNNTQIGMGSVGGRALYPVLYLLHGLSDDQSIWERRTSIERYVAELPLIVVMPDGGRGFYSDMVSGLNYGTFFADELPRIIPGFFPAATGRENTFVAGLSMGGYGALKLALSHPERFSFAGALSPVADIRHCAIHMASGEVAAIWGDPEKVAGGPGDLFTLMKRCRESGTPTPRIRQYCGDKDWLLEGNHKLKESFERDGGFDYRYVEAPGEHNWIFWDRHIQDLLKELPL